MIDISQIFQNSSGDLQDDQMQFLLDSLGVDEKLDDGILSFLIGGEIPSFEPGGQFDNPELLLGNEGRSSGSLDTASDFLLDGPGEPAARPQQGQPYGTSPRTMFKDGKEWYVYGTGVDTVAVPKDLVDGPLQEPVATATSADHIPVTASDLIPIKQNMRGLMIGGVEYDETGKPVSQRVAASPTPTTSTNSSGTFQEAFNAARAKSGKDGVFTWNGKQYNTLKAGESPGGAVITKKAAPTNRPQVPSSTRQQKDIQDQKAKIAELQKQYDISKQKDLINKGKKDLEISKQKQLINKQQLEFDIAQEKALPFFHGPLSTKEKQRRDIIKQRAEIARGKMKLISKEEGGEIPSFLGGGMVVVKNPINGEEEMTVPYSTAAMQGLEIIRHVPQDLNPSNLNLPPSQVVDSTGKLVDAAGYNLDATNATLLGEGQNTFIGGKFQKTTGPMWLDNKYMQSSAYQQGIETGEQAEMDKKLLEQQKMMNLFNTATGNTDYSVEDALYKVGESLAYNPSDDLFTNEDGEVNNTAKGVAGGFNILKGITSGGKALLGGAREVMGGYANQTRNDLIMNEYYRRQIRDRKNGNMQNREEGGPIPFFNDGGYLRFLEEGNEQEYAEMDGQDPREQMSLPQEMTGEFIQQQPDAAGVDPNAEVEDGEFVQHTDGQVQQVEGRSHDEGGERVALEAGTKVVSDKLKLGARNAKKISNEYGITVKAGDTYATALAKYTKKIGLKELNEQQEEYFNKLKKDEETRSEATSELNSEFLSEKINRIEQKKSVLEAIRANFTNVVYGLQQESKTPRTEEDTDQKKSPGPGPEEIAQALAMAAQSPEPEMAYGGSIPSFENGGGILALAEALEIDGATLEKYRDTLRIGIKTQNITDDYIYGFLREISPLKDSLPANISEFKTSNKIGKSFSGYKELSDDVKTFDADPTKFTLTGSTSVATPEPAGNPNSTSTTNTSKTLGSSPTTILKRDSEGENYISLNNNPLGNPEVIDSQEFTTTGEPITTSGKITKENLPTVNEYLYKNFPGTRKFFEVEEDSFGRKVNPKIKDVKGYQTHLNGVLKPSLTKWGRDNIKDAKELDNYLNALDQFDFRDKDKGTRKIDGVFGNFSANKSPIKWKFVTPTEKKELDKLGVSQVSDLYDDKGVLKPEFDFLSTESKDRLNKTREYEGLDLYIDEVGVEPENEQTPTKPYRKPLPKTYERPTLPDMSLEPPRPMEAHQKNQHRYNYIDPIKMSAESQLTEINRQNDAVAAQLDGMTDTQRAAALTNLGANTQQNAAKVISDVSAANAQNQFQVDQLNAALMNREEDARVADSNAYEKMQMTAKAKTEADYDDFMEKNREIRIKRFNYLTRDKQMNSMIENYKTDSEGNIIIDPLTGQPILVNGLSDNTDADKITKVTTDKDGNRTTTTIEKAKTVKLKGK